MADTRLTLADQALINALIVATAPHLGHGDNARMARGLLGGILAHVNRGNPKLTALIKAAEQMHAGGGYATDLRARSALADVALWRLGGALEAMKQGDAA